MPVEPFPAVLYVHYLGLFVLVAGVIANVASSNPKHRQRAAYFVAAPGFLMAWGGGHIATEFIDRELFSTINVIGFLGIVALMNAAHWRAAHGDHRDSPTSSESTGWLSLPHFGYLEGASLLALLFIAMPLKYLGDMDTAVRYVGMIHGILFLVFVAWVGVAARRGKWSIEKTAGAMVASVIPFGPFVADLAE